MTQKANPSYLDLFRTFFWMGLTAFGGPAMTVHIGFPAFLIMFILSVIYKHSKNIAVVERVLSGLRVVIVAIVANAAYAFGRKNFHSWNDWAIAIIAGGLFLTKLHPAIVLVAAALLGILFTKKDSHPFQKLESVKTFRFFLWAIASVAIGVILLFFLDKDFYTLGTIMLRIDLFSFGGGLASMPIMYHELVDISGWFNEKTFMDGVILGQATPGSIIIAATFFGYMHYGVLGSIFAGGVHDFFSGMKNKIFPYKFKGV